MTDLTNDQQPNTASPRAWLYGLMLRDPGRWTTRLGLLAARLRELGRGRRRRFGRMMAGAVAGASGVALLALLAGPLAPPAAAAGTTIYVDATCTLADAITAANTNAAVAGSDCEAGTGSGADADTIELTDDVIQVGYSAYYYDAYSGTPLITTPIIIDGQNYTLSRSSAAYFRLFTVSSSGNLTVRDLTLTGGDVSDYEYSDGGAIYSKGPLTLENVTFTGNKAGDVGGAVYVSNELSITDSTFSNNEAGSLGAGLFMYGNATAVISNTTFSDNTAAWGGGAIDIVYSDLTVINSTFTDNTGNFGGAIAGYEVGLSVEGSTFTNNTATTKGGGAIYMSGNLDVTNSTLTGNSAGTAGGAILIYQYGANPAGSISLDGVQIITNTSAGDGGGVYIELAEGSISNSTFSGNTSGNDGGAIANTGDLTLTDVTVSSNATTRFGGGLWSSGAFTMTTSVISNNNSSGWGGGIMAISAVGMSRITSSEIKDNTAANQGGGVYLNNSSGVISDTIISGNIANNGSGGGVGLDSNTGTHTMEIDNSTIKDNSTSSNGGGVNVRGGIGIIRNSTINGNSVDDNGGALNLNDGAVVTVTNSTLSGNSATGIGGAIYVSYYNSFNLINSTVTDNSAYAAAAIGVAAGNSISIYYSILSGNTGTVKTSEIYIADLTDENPDYANTVKTASNVLSSNALTSAEAFDNFTPAPTDFVATSDDENVAIDDILDTTLGDNGGPTLTHNLVKRSPAIDIVEGVTCDPATDQRGIARPLGDGCDAGAVEAPASPPRVFMSTEKAGAVGGVGYSVSDILMWDGDVWTKWFDAAAAGIAPVKNKPNVSAFWIPDEDESEVVLAFVQNSLRLPGVGRIDGTDLVRWDGSAFSLWFDGSDVDLNVKSLEKIDALHVLETPPPGRVGPACEAYLLISTQGNGMVRTAGPGTPFLRFGGEDLLGFCATNLGNSTAGIWEMLLDGSEVGLSRNNLDSISSNDDRSTLYLTTKKAINTAGAVGNHSMVFVYDVAGQTLSGPVFTAADTGLTQKVNGLQVVGELSGN